MYSNALEVGIYPSEFWDMSVQEVRDTVNSRHKQKQNDIYALSAMVRVAVLSAFSDKVKFPSSPFPEEKTEGNWKNSYNYLKALQKKQQGGA
jgi:hypothetical protein